MIIVYDDAIFFFSPDVHFVIYVCMYNCLFYPSSYMFNLAMQLTNLDVISAAMHPKTAPGLMHIDRAFQTSRVSVARILTLYSIGNCNNVKFSAVLAIYSSTPFYRHVHPRVALHICLHSSVLLY